MKSNRDRKSGAPSCKQLADDAYAMVGSKTNIGPSNTNPTNAKGQGEAAPATKKLRLHDEDSNPQSETAKQRQERLHKILGLFQPLSTRSIHDDMYVWLKGK